jgi:hypothetical protein
LDQLCRSCQQDERRDSVKQTRHNELVIDIVLHLKEEECCWVSGGKGLSAAQAKKLFEKSQAVAFSFAALLLFIDPA